jgi:hypothetical protein
LPPCLAPCLFLELTAGVHAEVDELGDEAKRKVRAERFGMPFVPAPPKPASKKDKAAKRRAKLQAEKAKQEAEQPQKKKRERVDVEKEGLLTADLAMRRREKFGSPPVAAPVAAAGAAGLDFFVIRCPSFLTLPLSVVEAALPEEKEEDTKRARQRSEEDEDERPLNDHISVDIFLLNPPNRARLEGVRARASHGAAAVLGSGHLATATGH